MEIISHRGNLNGPNSEKENHPDYIEVALIKGFDVEIDVWVVDGKFILGHDEPQYEVDKNFILNHQLWHHAKTMEAMFILNDMKPNHLINCFYHQNDDCTLTSSGYIWTFPRLLPLSNQSIAVIPERVIGWELEKAYGICTDYPIEYHKNLNLDPFYSI